MVVMTKDTGVPAQTELAEEITLAWTSSCVKGAITMAGGSISGLIVISDMVFALADVTWT
jgi:hypothetical protein